MLSNAILINYGLKYLRATIPLRQFSTLIEQGKINDMSLTIYYISPSMFTFFPITTEDLVNGNEHIKIVINVNDLEEHIDLFKQIENTVVRPVWKKTSYEDVRVYYVFETEENGKIFDVVMWGFYESIFVNGVEVKENDIFYDIIMPFLPEETAEQLESYIDN